MHCSVNNLLRGHDHIHTPSNAVFLCRAREDTLTLTWFPPAELLSICMYVRLRVGLRKITSPQKGDLRGFLSTAPNMKAATGLLQKLQGSRNEDQCADSCQPTVPAINQHL